MVIIDRVKKVFLHRDILNRFAACRGFGDYKRTADTGAYGIGTAQSVQTCYVPYQ